LPRKKIHEGTLRRKGNYNPPPKKTMGPPLVLFKGGGFVLVEKGKGKKISKNCVQEYNCLYQGGKKFEGSVVMPGERREGGSRPGRENMGEVRSSQETSLLDQTKGGPLKGHVKKERLVADGRAGGEQEGGHLTRPETRGKERGRDHVKKNLWGPSRRIKNRPRGTQT